MRKIVTEKKEKNSYKEYTKALPCSEFNYYFTKRHRIFTSCTTVWDTGL